jgi:sugar porter (SP) family MFS transporter
MVISIPIGFIMDAIGRKASLLILTIPMITGWFLILFAVNYEMMIAARFLLGLSIGGFGVVAPVYVAEIADKNIRGALCSFFQVQISFGLFLVYTFGAFFSVFWLNVICTIFPLIIGGSFLLLPESPQHLIHKNKIGLAENSLKKIKGKSFNVDREINELKDEETKRKLWNQTHSLRSSLARPGSMKVLWIAIGLSFYHQFSGMGVISFYTTDIFEMAKSNIKPEFQTIFIGFLQVCTCFVPIYFADRWGRRALLMISSVGVGLSTGTLGTFFYFKDAGFEMGGFEWLPLVALSAFMISFIAGIGPMLYVVRSEICAPDIKGFVVGLSVTLVWLFTFITTKFFSNLIDLITIGPTFWMFGIIGFSGVLFTYFSVPETKGKSLLEIQDFLGNSRGVTRTKL